VILLHKRNTDVQVYDFDTTLNFPCSLKEYVTKALQNEQNFITDIHRSVLLIKHCTFNTPYFITFL
jgi:hypothetical protein